MRNCVVGLEAFESCMLLEAWKHLFVGYGFDDSMVESLFPIKSLEHLDLSPSMATDEAMIQIVQLPKLNILTLGPNMGGESLRILAGCQTVAVLHLGFSQVGDVGVASLAASESICGLNRGHRPITGRLLETLGIPFKCKFTVEPPGISGFTVIATEYRHQKWRGFCDDIYEHYGLCHQGLCHQLGDSTVC
ncbi:hypothetical protein SAMN06265222_12123 [Neorhodopirellula lusitana]|uniref:Uncharacterized protein n=1 Tax=Neorhodopirellula lusitana TaxID=445327 RepID=A0ABY1QNN0_9BACT|nr:hypothetical protein [Neorhodopirellula lusitana]SMP76372.1 hypothetical protein SAMN06265222_12123 [Neorhodopirellula lusitana]